MGVNFMAAKKGSRAGKMGKAAKKASMSPTGPPMDSVPASMRVTKSQRAAMMATKEIRARSEPASSMRKRAQNKIERRMGHSKMRPNVSFGRHILKGSIQT